MQGLMANENSGMRDLDFSRNMIANKGAEHLASYLSSQNCKLNRLNITECQITGLGAFNLCTGLRNCLSFRNFVADRNVFWYSTIFKPLSQAIGLYMQHIQLNSCKLGDRGASSIAEAIYKNKNILTVQLKSNGIGDNGGRSLGEAIQRKGIQIKVLDL